MLMIHRGAELVGLPELQRVFTPEATKSHVPIPHHAVVEQVRYALQFYGHEVAEEHHAITPDGMRYFGTLSLRSPYGDYTDMVGLRNSHDKKFPIGISIGAKVFVCDNLSFSGDHVIRRKHTAKAKRDLPGLVAEIIEPLNAARETQHRTIELYKETQLDQQLVDHAIMEMYRLGVINVQRIAEVHQQWEDPAFEEFAERNAWSLFNAVTHVLSGRVVSDPESTQKLHTIIDGFCVRH